MRDRREREMSWIAELAERILDGYAGRDLAERIERELTTLGSVPDFGETRRPDLCGACGGLRREGDHRFNSDRVCRCGGRTSRLLSYLDAVDPGRRMTLETFDASEPTASVALEQAGGIVSGERSRGMFLMGLPGRGKSHLMVATGRALLTRNRDAGYYNVVRLISRIQDSYSDYGGESRRAIVQSVSSHEVVLLDDLGKEHVSANVDSIVYELFDALCSSATTLVVSTNVPTTRDDSYRGPVLQERYDEAVRSRLSAMCERFVLRGVDRRRLT